MKWSVRVLGNRQLNAQLDRFAREAMLSVEQMQTHVWLSVLS